MSKDIKSYKDLKNVIIKLRAQTGNFCWYAKPFRTFLEGNKTKSTAIFTEWGFKPVIRFIRDQFLAPAVLFSGAKFLYRGAVKDPKRLFCAGSALALILISIKLKKLWYNLDKK